MNLYSMDGSMGARQAFSVKEVLDKGWEITKKNWLSYILVMICVALVSALITLVSGGFNGQFFRVIFFLLNLAWQSLAFIAIVRLVLHAVDGKAIVIKDLFKAGWMDVLYMLGTMVLVGLVVGIGLMLFIVPGIIAALMFGYAPYLTVEKKLDPIAAMKASMDLTAGHRTEMFIYALALIGVGIALAIGFAILSAIAGVLANAADILGIMAGFTVVVVAVVAYFAYTMVSMFGWGYIYRKLTAMRPGAMNA